MTYIKLLTALAGLALLTACGGGGTAETPDNSGGGDTTDCKANPFHADCSADTSATTLRQTMCLANNSADPSCGGILTTYCEANDVTGCPNATTADWLATFTEGDALPTTPNATTRKNQFLQATTTGFNTGANADIRATGGSPLENIAIQTLNFDNTATATGGVAYFGGSLFDDSGTRVEDTYYYYAGILAGTDLGAPITKTITSARWTGQIRAVASESEGTLTANPIDGFGLNIIFNGTGGTMKTIFTNSGFVYSIDGRFDDKGIIEGDVAFGQPAGVGDARSVDTSHSSYSPGTLTGIIGQNGAVGAFHSGRVGVTAGASASSFSGGFVALPPAPPPPPDPCIALGNCMVNHGDYLASFGNTPPLATAALATANTAIRSHFLSVGANGILDTTGLGISTTDRTEPMPLTLSRDGDADDGVTYVIGTIESVTQSFVGLLPSTDLGAPLPSDTVNAAWGGSYYARPNRATNDITFNIDFGAGTIDATDTQGFFTTTFDLKFTATGVITGDVLFNDGDAPDTAQARGLIGEQGLVGGFANTDGGVSGVNLYGGFVAAPPAPNHATFKAYYADSARTPDRTLLATPTTTNATAAFLEGTATGLDTTGLAFTANGTFMPVAVRLKEAENGNDGFAVMYGISGSSPRFRAGLLSGTDLGPALSGTSTATWTGSLHFAGALSGLIRFALPTVNVDFDNGTIKTDAVTVLSERTVAIDGLFRAGGNNNDLPVGILGGSAIYTDLGVPANIPLIGLIGTKGVIGVFRGVSANVIGGFQASPPNPCVALETCVDTADWLASFAAGTVPPATPDAPRKSQFLAGTETGFADGANVNIRNLLGTQTVDNPVETIEFTNADAAAGGVAFFGGRLYNGGMSTTNQFHYAGVLAGTNLGAPITEIIPTAVRWTGKIQSYSKSNSAAKFLADNIADFGLDITFNGTSGTLKEFFKSNLTNHFFINGTFDANGIITGSVELGNKSPNGNTINTATNLYSPGTLSGIIGQDGLVGVYHSGHVTLRAHADNDDRYSGGFIASPPVQ